MELTNSIEIIDLCLYLKKEDTLILADTHIGYEEAMSRQGVLVPFFQFKEITKRLEMVLEKISAEKISMSGERTDMMKRTDRMKRADGMKRADKTKRIDRINRINKLNKIIINGDVKHEFGEISGQEWRHTLRLLDFLERHCREVILIKGNHDTILGPIAKKRGVRLLDNYRAGDILIAHGHKSIDKKELKGIRTIIIGHEHPAVSICEGARIEAFKCFLDGKWRGRRLIVQPSFNLVSEGADVLKERLLSPLLQHEPGNFQVYIIADRIYNFGRLGRLKQLNAFA